MISVHDFRSLLSFLALLKAKYTRQPFIRISMIVY
jgi:hypothetical protein